MERSDYGYYHLCSPGEDAKNFIVDINDWYAAFNIVGVCAAACRDVVILSFSIEDSHPHFLLYGRLEDCEAFKEMYTKTYMHHIISTRGNSDGIVIRLELIPVKDEKHLMNAGAYTVIQPTKDGKRIMPYDYLWGTGSMYFRQKNHVPIWLFDNSGHIGKTVRIKDLTIRERLSLLHSKNSVPDDWLVCNGFLLPANYIDVAGFENIYKTHNCFRAFCSMTAKQIQELLAKIAEYNGITVEDFEARKLCSQLCMTMFHKQTPASLDPQNRLLLAKGLRNTHHLSFRQISTLVRIPEKELRRYL